MVGTVWAGGGLFVELLPRNSRNMVARKSATTTSISEPNKVSVVVSAAVVVLMKMLVMRTGVGVEVVVWVV